MLAGLFDATQGVVEVNGWSLPNDAASIQRCLGVMPQHDILWGELTPVEHMQVFAAITGVPEAQVDADIQGILAQVSELWGGCMPGPVASQGTSYHIDALP